MKKFYWLLALPLLFVACLLPKRKKVNTVDLKSEMIAAESSFSKMSREEGTKKALMEYIDSNGVFLRPKTYPLAGSDAVDYISQLNDTSFTMTWETKGGNIAESGELGYTFGIYSITPKIKDTVIYGTYVNVWKKEPDGVWKLMLDSGNEGLEEE